MPSKPVFIGLWGFLFNAVSNRLRWQKMPLRGKRWQTGGKPTAHSSVKKPVPMRAVSPSGVLFIFRMISAHSFISFFLAYFYTNYPKYWDRFDEGKRKSRIIQKLWPPHSPPSDVFFWSDGAVVWRYRVSFLSSSGVEWDGSAHNCQYFAEFRRFYILSIKLRQTKQKPSNPQNPLIRELTAFVWSWLTVSSATARRALIKSLIFSESGQQIHGTYMAISINWVSKTNSVRSALWRTVVQSCNSANWITKGFCLNLVRFCNSVLFDSATAEWFIDSSIYLKIGIHSSVASFGYSLRSLWSRCRSALWYPCRMFLCCRTAWSSCLPIPNWNKTLLDYPLMPILCTEISYKDIMCVVLDSVR